MMDTPICDFAEKYRERGALRLHMPGHKGRPFLGMEAMDITEIDGADELYRPQGIIQKSEENASALFGTKKTFYSAEGSSLSIRAMVYLALLHGREAGRPPLILAGRNAHRAFLSAAGLTGAQVEWIYPEGEGSLISCPITGPVLEKALDALPEAPAAVYVTSPDYLGNLLDIAGLAAVCHGRGVPLLVDNAHGAYLRFLPRDGHPITLGADMCCDSAHKTLPVLTGGGYLHIGPQAPDTFAAHGNRALALFASSSPSYLILQSLDACNRYLAGDFRERLAALAQKTEALKSRLEDRGYALAGNEPAKITVQAKPWGYTGDEMHRRLGQEGMECEFSDPDFLTVMLTPELPENALARMEKTLAALPRRAPVSAARPPLPRPPRVLSIREAMLAPAREMPLAEAEGRVLADAHVSCPPCVPIMAWGERIDGDAVDCFRYYGVDRVLAAEEKRD